MPLCAFCQHSKSKCIFFVLISKFIGLSFNLMIVIIYNLIFAIVLWQQNIKKCVYLIERRQTLFRLIFGVFLILHGLVHLLYFGQSRRLFELQSGMVWPDGSWVFSRFLGVEKVRMLAGFLCILAASGFVAGGVGLLIKQVWWQPAIVASAIFSAVIFILLWDKKMQKLHDKGAANILINLAILAALLLLKWPST